MPSKFTPAATHTEEVQLIAELTKNFGERKSYQKYAAWLDNHDLEKAAHIRGLEASMFETPFENIPKAPGGMRFWDNSVGGKLQRGIREFKKFGVQDHLDWIFKWVRPIVGMRPAKSSENDLPLGCSKFGGPPDIPVGFDWPTCSKGPLGFNAQINFAEIENSLATAYFGLPKSGLLLVFTFSDCDEGIEPGMMEEVNGVFRDIEGLTQVFYIRDVDNLQRQAPKVELGEANELLNPYALEMVDSLDLPVAKDVTEDESVIDSIDQIYKDDSLRYRINKSPHWLMGFSVHARTDNTSPGPDWQSLMTLDSGTPGWSWCDGEHLDIYIHSDSLRNATFDKVFGYAA